MKEILRDKNKTTDMQIGNTLNKLQTKKGEAYEPLSKMWQYLENKCTAKDETVDFDMGMILNWAQQCFYLVKSCTQRHFTVISILY